MTLMPSFRTTVVQEQRPQPFARWHVGELLNCGESAAERGEVVADMDEYLVVLCVVTQFAAGESAQVDAVFEAPVEEVDESPPLAYGVVDGGGESGRGDRAGDDVQIRHSRPPDRAGDEPVTADRTSRRSSGISSLTARRWSCRSLVTMACRAEP